MIVHHMKAGADSGFCARRVQNFARALARAQNSDFLLIIHELRHRTASSCQQVAESRFRVAS